MTRDRRVIDLVGAAAALGASPDAARQRIPDLQNPYRAFRKANIVCAFEWAPMQAGHLEPAMFLTTYPHVPGGKGFVIPLSRLPLYVDDEAGTATPRLAEVARKAALRLGLDETAPTISLLCDVILLGVPDLCAMPSQPPAPH